MEGLPTILLGVWINRSLAETPLTASFLKAEEAEWLHHRQLRAKVSASQDSVTITLSEVSQGKALQDSVAAAMSKVSQGHALHRLLVSPRYQGTLKGPGGTS